MEDTIVPKKKKAAPKIATDETEKKKKASKVTASTDGQETAPTLDQEVPAKPKKKRAPKADVTDEPITTEEPVKKKKSEAPKPNVTNEPIRTEEPVKKKKPEASKTDASYETMGTEEPVKKKKPEAPKTDATYESMQTEEPIKKKKTVASKTDATYESMPTEESVKKKKPEASKTDAPYESMSIDEPVKKKKPEASKTDAPYESMSIDEPVKKKKTAVPKTDVIDDAIPVEESVKKKKPKALKPAPIEEDDFQMVGIPTIAELEPTIEQKPKERKSKKTTSQSFEDLQPANLDQTDPLYPENNVNYTDPVRSSGNDLSEYEQTIIDAYSNLGSKINFADYVGNDQWGIIYLPKIARPDQKSLLRQFLPGGGGKTEKSGSKPAVPKGSLFSRIRNSMTMLVRDETNLIFGERSNYDEYDMEDDPDGIDTDNLHRYAQQLRELEDKDREVNPEFLVIRDGKTIYGVHESDADGKMKLATRKPIYDRQADQTPDEQLEKKNLFARLKNPFTRNKDDKNSKSANATPDAHIHRKSSRKSLNNESTAVNDVPLNV